jgi:hypothetical protein
MGTKCLARALTVARGLLVVGLSVGVACGCGGAGSGTGQVTGKVSYQGKPLSVGTVAFFGSNNRVANSLILPDGTYTITNAPMGEVKISVETPPQPTSGGSGGPPKGMMMDPAKFGVKNPDAKKTAMGGQLEKHVVVPDKYKDAQKSGLTYTVKAGEQTHNIDIP